MVGKDAERNFWQVPIGKPQPGFLGFWSQATSSAAENSTPTNKQLLAGCLVGVQVETLIARKRTTAQPEPPTVSWIPSDQSSHKIEWAPPKKHARMEMVHPGPSRGGPDGTSKLHEQATRPHFTPPLPSAYTYGRMGCEVGPS